MNPVPGCIFCPFFPFFSPPYLFFVFPACVTVVAGLDEWDWIGLDAIMTP